MASSLQFHALNYLLINVALEEALVVFSHHASLDIVLLLGVGRALHHF